METLRVKCITWNVQTGWPEQILAPLLGVKPASGVEAAATSSSKKSTANTLPHIFVVSLQEVRSQPQNMVLDMVFEEPWTKQVMDELAPYGYARIGGERLQGCVTSIFVQRELIPELRDIHTAVTRTGLAGFWGNKGGVCVRFSVRGCSLCCVNCHLAPHDGGYSERVQQYSTILHSTTFPDTPPTTSILYHDYVFWMGDLNFRLSSSVGAEDIATRVHKGDLAGLFELDELHKAQTESDAFEPLTEAPITFPPTYKYKEHSTNEYDLNRRPAWTDRILHQVLADAYENVKLSVDQTSYKAHQEFTQSDHKPVTADFTIKVFSDHRERCVELRPNGPWRVGDGGAATVKLDSDVTVSSMDYVALYKENFRSMEQYVSYCYLPERESQTGPGSLTVEIRDDLVQEVGQYRLVYVSRKYNCYLGMSETFPVLPRARQQ